MSAATPGPWLDWVDGPGGRGLPPRVVEAEARVPGFERLWRLMQEPGAGNADLDLVASSIAIVAIRFIEHLAPVRRRKDRCPTCGGAW